MLLKPKSIIRNRITSIDYVVIDETINHIINECSKLAQKEYKTIHDWVKKVIHWELCKKLKFDHTTKWYMHKPESIQKNETHKILWDFETQTNHLIPTRRANLLTTSKKKKQKKKTKPERNITNPVLADYEAKIKESEKETNT